MLLKQFYTKTMSSEIGFKGLLKKITILIIVALSNVLQQITGDNVAIREIVIMFYVANEGISVLENVAVIYPRMPKAIKIYCSKFVTVTVRTVSEYNIWGVRYMIVGINCGHTVSGTVGSGAVGFLNESNETRRVGYKVMEYLRAKGVTVVDCTDDYSSTVSENLKKIVDKANAQPLDLFRFDTL